MNTIRFEQTKEVIKHSLQYVHGRTLDLGAGTAKYKGLITQKSSEYIAFDLFEGEHIDVVGDITHTGFDDASFDTIISTQVFEHIPAPWEAVREIRRLLRPGGMAIVSAPFINPYHADPYDFYRYSTEGFKALFRDGFEVVECEPYSKLFMVFSEMIHHTVFSPYAKKKKGADRIMGIIKRIARFLDKFVRSTRIYGNTYIVVRKL